MSRLGLKFTQKLNMDVYHFDIYIIEKNKKPYIAGDLVINLKTSDYTLNIISGRDYLQFDLSNYESLVDSALELACRLNDVINSK